MGGNKPRKLEWVLADALRRRMPLGPHGRSARHQPRPGNGAVRARARAAHGAGARGPAARRTRPRQFERIVASGADGPSDTRRYRTMAAVPWLMAAQLRPAAHAAAVLPRGRGLLAARLRRLRGGGARAGCSGAARGSAGARAPGGRRRSGGTRRDWRSACGWRAFAPASSAVQVNDRTPLGPRAIARLARRTERLLRGRGARFPTPSASRTSDFGFERGFLGAGYGHRTDEGERSRRARARPRGPGARAGLHGQGDGGADRLAERGELRRRASPLLAHLRLGRARRRRASGPSYRRRLR